MPLIVNLRHLEKHPVRLQGQLSVAELDIDTMDEVIQVTKPLEYDLEVELLEGGLSAQGSLRMPVQCHCVRCLKTFEETLEIPDMNLHVPLQGEDAVPVDGDLVDLTGLLREDILLEFPQHPLCDQECEGLSESALESPAKGSSDQNDTPSSAWTELNKLKF
jgi:uncharacterized metal-binding protein YceD (DUF177 family)